MEMVLKPRPLGLGCLHSMGHLLGSAPGARGSMGVAPSQPPAPAAPPPRCPSLRGSALVVRGQRRQLRSCAEALLGVRAGPGSRRSLSLLPQHEVFLLPFSQIRGLSFTLRMGVRLLIQGPRFGLVPCGHWSPRAFLRHRGPCQPIFLADTQRQSGEELIRAC